MSKKYQKSLKRIIDIEHLENLLSSQQAYTVENSCPDPFIMNGLQYQTQFDPWSNFNLLLQNYCFWDNNLSKPLFENTSQLQVNNLKEIESESHDFYLPKLDPEIDVEEMKAKNMTKEEMYFVLLKDYKYETINYFDEKKQKNIPQYKWGFEGCSKVLLKPWNLLDHVRMHVGVKPYECKWCGKTFTQKGNLKKHARQHIKPDVNTRKRYSCNLWGKGYTERYNLKVNRTKCVYNN